ncbi:hypothetical protein ACFLYA_02645 [Candidatus Dependentiae bacterium]
MKKLEPQMFDRVFYRRGLKKHFYIFDYVSDIVTPITMLISPFFLFYCFFFLKEFSFLREYTTIFLLLMVGYVLSTVIGLFCFFKYRTRAKFNIGLNNEGMYVRDHGFIEWDDINSIGIDKNQWIKKIVIHYNCGLNENKIIELSKFDSHIMLEELFKIIKSYKK